MNVYLHRQLLLLSPPWYWLHSDCRIIPSRFSVLINLEECPIERHICVRFRDSWSPPVLPLLFPYLGTDRPKLTALSFYLMLKHAQKEKEWWIRIGERSCECKWILANFLSPAPEKLFLLKGGGIAGVGLQRERKWVEIGTRNFVFLCGSTMGFHPVWVK